MSKQFTSLSLPSLCLSPSASWPPLLGGRVTTSGSSRPCACLCILAFLPHVPAFAAIPSRNCISSQGWGFPGLIKTKRVFQFRVIERVQHINMLGQRYQPVSLQGGDRWWSWHTRTNILSGCGFCLIGSFAAQIPTYLMLMMKSQEGCEILVNLMCMHAVFICTLVRTVTRQFNLHSLPLLLREYQHTHMYTHALSSFLILTAHCEGRRKFQLKLK